ncbi:N-acetylglucosamine-6-phosphate deacetylase [Acidilobus saccharovorans]|nr:N-acetylglucosamine-6-phosphate deacetylase [Acidilobus saccharovorans]
MGSLTLRHAVILTPREVIPDGFVRIVDGAVAGVGPEPAEQGPDDVNVRGHLVAPGLVDVHIHGAGGYDVMSLKSRDLEGMAKFLACRGVTSFVPTTVSLPPEDIKRACTALISFMDSRPRGAARALGLHLEGPYISPARRGAHLAENLRAPDLGELRELLASCRGVIREVTIAPELPGAIDAIRLLSSSGVTVQLGHTDATFSQAMEALRAGATKFTHLFDAMRPFHHREPGTVGAALLSNAYVELIGDLVHVSPEAILLAYRVIGPRRLVLVSDATPAAGLPEGEYSFWGLSVVSRGGAAWIRGSNTLAGSASTLETDMANLYRVGIDISDAVGAATQNPAMSIGAHLKEGVGELRAGMRGDLVILNKELRVVASVVDGETVCGSL